jgi:hypothetical protein
MNTFVDEYGHKQEALEGAEELEEELAAMRCSNCGTADANVCGCFGLN